MSAEKAKPNSEALDIRSSLGLPPSATDAEVQRYLSEIRARALGNLAGPEGWTGIAEGAEAVVFETFTAKTLTNTLKDALPKFDGDVEMVQYTPVEGGTRINVRVRKESA